MDFCTKLKLGMMTLLDTKQIGCSRFFTKPDIDLWKDIFTGIGCNNIAIFHYPSCTKGLHLHLMDDVTTYLYGSLENHIYMKIPTGFYLPNKENSKEGIQ